MGLWADLANVLVKGGLPVQDASIARIQQVPLRGVLHCAISVKDVVVWGSRVLEASLDVCKAWGYFGVERPIVMGHQEAWLFK